MQTIERVLVSFDHWPPLIQFFALLLGFGVFCVVFVGLVRVVEEFIRRMP